MQYYANGKLRGIGFRELTPAEPVQRVSSLSAERRRQMASPGVRPAEAASGHIVATLTSQRRRLSTRFRAFSDTTSVSPTGAVSTTVIPTETVVIAGARSSEVEWMKSRHGMKIVQEGSHGKVLLQAPAGAADGIATAFRAAKEVYERGHVTAAHPDFLRVVQRPAPSEEPAGSQWALDNDGHEVGIANADVHALAAWALIEGLVKASDRRIRVAVLDEGVDTQHPYLKDAVVAERDFVDGHPHARPTGNDAHGTACAGIIFSNNERAWGLAPELGLVAVRIAKSSSLGFWVFDDFETADAIDWAWDEGRADVLSNSWGGGPEVDVIREAIDRARTEGRDGRGCVVVAAAGNEQRPIAFPGSLPKVLTVGASNQWDERKTRTSQDGEAWWGSNYGPTLNLLAPGVQIMTTDIQGGRGYTGGLVTDSFNGTSAATPFVAGAAAMVLSLRPDLAPNQVADILTSTADPLRRGGPAKKFVGKGRLNVYAALRAARG